jgi:hypothetical protein
MWPKTHRVLGLVSEPSSPLHVDRCGHRRSSLFVATVALLWWWSETQRVRPKSTSHVTDGRAYSWRGSFIGPSTLAGLLNHKLDNKINSVNITFTACNLRTTQAQTTLDATFGPYVSVFFLRFLILINVLLSI